VTTNRTSSRGAADIAVAVEPLGNLIRIEPDEMAPLYEGDASFMDEATDVADVHAERLGDLGDVEQSR
jgi:hypothetical protein